MQGGCGKEKGKGKGGASKGGQAGKGQGCQHARGTGGKGAIFQIWQSMPTVKLRQRWDTQPSRYPCVRVPKRVENKAKKTFGDGNSTKMD